jgi:hypothetical protein
MRFVRPHTTSSSGIDVFGHEYGTAHAERTSLEAFRVDDLGCAESKQFIHEVTLRLSWFSAKVDA